MAYNYKKSKDSDIKPEFTLFDILGNILVEKSMQVYEAQVKSEIFKDMFVPHMIVRYLSLNSNPNVRKIVLDHQIELEHFSEEPKLMYKMLMKVVPKCYNKFTPYIKSGFPVKKRENNE